MRGHAHPGLTSSLHNHVLHTTAFTCATTRGGVKPFTGLQVKLHTEVGVEYNNIHSESTPDADCTTNHRTAGVWDGWREKKKAVQKTC